MDGESKRTALFEPLSVNHDIKNKPRQIVGGIDGILLSFGQSLCLVDILISFAIPTLPYWLHAAKIKKILILYSKIPYLLYILNK